MAKSVQAIRGMNDLTPEVLASWQHVESVAKRVLRAYGYREIRFPIVEKSELFSRSIGEDTDIVEKEMYTFEDRNSDSLTLRPEGTASCVRASIEAGLLHNQLQRFWYMGPMFRHERPQKGRYRQFHQVGVETFGMPGPDVDAELIFMSARLWKELGIDGLGLEINSLGSTQARLAYRENLIKYLEPRRSSLDSDSLRRLERNPLRILDSKNPELKEIIEGAPILSDCLDNESREHFEELKECLDAAGIQYTVNPRLVRGLDYYNRTVFEWFTDKLGAQNTICAGGRFDGLVEQLGGKATPAAGFAVGLERIIELVDSETIDCRELPDVYFVLPGSEAGKRGALLAESLRDKGWRIQCHSGDGSLKSQMKKADISGAAFALILGEDEIKNGSAAIKELRESGEQITIKFDEIESFLRTRLN